MLILQLLNCSVNETSPVRRLPPPPKEPCFALAHPEQRPPSWPMEVLMPTGVATIAAIESPVARLMHAGLGTIVAMKFLSPTTIIRFCILYQVGIGVLSHILVQSIHFHRFRRSWHKRISVPSSTAIPDRLDLDTLRRGSRPYSIVDPIMGDIFLILRQPGGTIVKYFIGF